MRNINKLGGNFPVFSASSSIFCEHVFYLLRPYFFLCHVFHLVYFFNYFITSAYKSVLFSKYVQDNGCLKKKENLFIISQTYFFFSPILITYSSCHADDIYPLCNSIILLVSLHTVTFFTKKAPLVKLHNMFFLGNLAFSFEEKDR